MIKRDTLLFANIASNFILKIISLSLSLIALRVLVNSVGIENYGIYILSATLLGYFSLAGIGIPGALLKYIPEYIAKKDNKSLNVIVSSAYIFYLFVGLLMFLVLFIISFWGAEYFKISHGNLATAKSIFIMVGLWAIVSWPMGIYGQILMGAQRFYMLNIAEAIQLILCNILYILVAYLKLNIEFAVICLAFSQFVQFLLTSKMVNHILPDLDISLKNFHLPVLKTLFEFSVWILLMQIAGLIIYQSDQIMISLFIAMSLVSIYTVNATPLMGVRLFNGMILSVITPAVSDADSKNDKNFIIQLIFRGTRIASVFIFSMIIVIMANSHALIYVWMGAHFSNYHHLCILLLYCFLLSAPLGIAAHTLYGKGQVKILGILAMINAMINITITFILVRRIGINGVVLGTLIAQMIMTPITLKIFCHKLGIKVIEFLRKVIFKIIIPAGVLYLLFDYCSNYLSVAPRFFPTALFVSIEFIASCVIIAILACDKEDLGKLINIFLDIISLFQQKLLYFTNRGRSRRN